MGSSSLEVTLISARDLKDVNLFSRLDVYAIVWLSSDPRNRHRTAPDCEGRRNPNWNSTFRFTIPPLPAAASATLHVLLRARRSLGDREVGEVHIPLRELLSSPAGDSSNSLSYQVRRPSSRRPKGVLHLSYNLSDPIPSPNPNPNPKSTDANTTYPPPPASRPEEPVTAYPAPAFQPPPYGGYQPYPAPAYGYPPQPGASGYGYQAAGYGYGAPQPAAAPAGRGMGAGLGMGLGAGLIGGTLGGLLMGDLISDAAAYDAGYDAGFGDGFDF
ncbi:hypothetical protein J5N97_015320 [Dioscorea zingiberensis]|uniref:C2 domain-containing protein n=1 Tax=Dioscorea zingiberensis TaxID=325984 RepID=A0A9D5HKJ4_9LILI|nr:hypothetical protein J5N97_015320 [Dioscorea zingiberensis]